MVALLNMRRQSKAQGIENKFIGKNFVFDERLGERITDDIIAVCHQCGNHVMITRIAKTMVVIYCLFNARHVASNITDVARKTANKFWRCPLRNRKKLERELTKEGRFLKKGDLKIFNSKDMISSKKHNRQIRPFALESSTYLIALARAYRDIPGKAIVEVLNEYIKSPWEKEYEVIPDEQDAH